ncbi:GNAT family N-acetyltransferase [Candidatus Aalborgicola defluviihabitans]|uniref:GNAT family N-acetyltransferase n=1 Tax=Candidatus Aalborgicola defluviihabitans TaxID=3386187 RepID=UPI00390C0751|nr:GNAT family N-acetyltransferase [Burkholderiales bacterium]
MSIQYNLIPFSETVRDAYLDLLTQQQKEVALGKLEWKFANNPKGLGMIASATKDGRIVGINAFMANMFQVDGFLRLGYQSMDTVVSPDVRGQGVFGRLVETFYDQCNAELVYGFPNSNSAPGFFGKLGWTNFGAVPMLTRPLRTGYFLKRFVGIAPDFRIPLLSQIHVSTERITRFTQQDTETWMKFSSSNFCSVQRDADFLNWRLMDHPTENYDTQRAVDGSFVASTLTLKHAGSVGYVMEAIGDEATLAALIGTTLRQMQTRGADVALAWCLPGSPNYRAYRKAGFFPFPVGLRPIVVNFGARPIHCVSSTIAEKLKWYISYLDSDTV